MKKVVAAPPAVVPITADRLGHLLDLAVKAEEYIKQLRAYARARLDEGKPVRGWKLVAGKGRKEWQDEAEAEAVLLGLLGEEAVVESRRVITPAHALSVVTKEDRVLVEALFARLAGGPVMAPESDKRPALELSSAEDEFADVADETGNEG